jgi:hypothetical protein
MYEYYEDFVDPLFISFSLFFRMRVVFTAKVFPPACAKEEDSKPILRPAQSCYTPSPPQSR